MSGVSPAFRASGSPYYVKLTDRCGLRSRRVRRFRPGVSRVYVTFSHWTFLRAHLSRSVGASWLRWRWLPLFLAGVLVRVPSRAFAVPVHSSVLVCARCQADAAFPLRRAPLSSCPFCGEPVVVAGAIFDLGAVGGFCRPLPGVGVDPVWGRLDRGECIVPASSVLFSYASESGTCERAS